MNRKLLGLAGSVLMFSACASTPVAGLLYSDVQSARAIASNAAGNRVGEACATSYLGLVAQGDASVETARRNGGITMISSVDQSFSNILFFYTKYCTIVRGR